MSAKTVQTNLQLDIPHRERVKRLGATHGWSMSETVSRAVRLMDGLYDLYAQQAQAHGGPEAELLQRILQELGPAALINKEIKKAAVRYDRGAGIRLGDGQERAAIVLDEYAFSLDDDDNLVATTERGGELALFDVEGGQLVTKRVFPAGLPALN